MLFDPGQLLVVEFPFTDRTLGKARPVVVISLRAFNAGEDCVVLPLSSRVVDNDPYSIPILSSHKEFAATGLPQDSCIKWTKPVTISSRVVKRKLGFIPAEILVEIQTKVRSLFSES